MISMLLALWACHGRVEHIDEAVLPACQPLNNVYHQQQLWLIAHRPGTQALYLIHNTSRFELIVNHPMKYPAASAGWALALKPGRWSALALQQSPFWLDCTVKRRNQFKLVNCEKVLKACVQPHPQLKQAGNYWVAANQELKQLQQSITRRSL